MNCVEMTLICNACEKDISVECKDACKGGVCEVANHAKDTAHREIKDNP